MATLDLERVQEGNAYTSKDGELVFVIKSASHISAVVDIFTVLGYEEPDVSVNGKQYSASVFSINGAPGDSDKKPGSKYLVEEFGSLYRKWDACNHLYFGEADEKAKYGHSGYSHLDAQDLGYISQAFPIAADLADRAMWFENIEPDSEPVDEDEEPHTWLPNMHKGPWLTAAVDNGVRQIPNGGWSVTNNPFVG